MQWSCFSLHNDLNLSPHLVKVLKIEPNGLSQFEITEVSIIAKNSLYASVCLHFILKI